MLRWKKILVATDFSAPSRVALRSAMGLADQMGATVEVVHVVERLPQRTRLLVGSFGDAGVQAERIRRADAHLQRLLRRIRTAGVAVEGEVRYGRPWEEILDAARETGAEVVCIGNSGHSRLQRLLLGSTAERVVRQSTVPVLVTSRKVLRSIDRVLLPVDLSQGAAGAARFAARRFPGKVQVHGLYVVPPPPPIPEFFGYPVDAVVLKREIRSILRDAGIVRPTVEVVVFEDPAETILRYVRRRGVDVILISTHGRAGLEHLMLGSVAEKVIRHADVPVLVLPGPRTAARSRRGSVTGTRRSR
jgi:nucleotide-binding universal stress UspA family protein